MRVTLQRTLSNNSNGTISDAEERLEKLRCLRTVDSNHWNYEDDNGHQMNRTRLADVRNPLSHTSTGSGMMFGLGPWRGQNV